MTDLWELWTFPEEVKAWVDGLGWLDFVGVLKGRRAHSVQFRKSLPKGRVLDKPLVEVIFRHELVAYDALGEVSSEVSYVFFVEKP